MLVQNLDNNVFVIGFVVVLKSIVSSISRAMWSISPNIINKSINTKWNHKPRRNQVVLYFNLCIQPPYVWYSFPSITPVNCDKLSKAMDCYGYCQWSIWIPLAYNIVPFTYVLVFWGFLWRSTKVLLDTYMLWPNKR